jgi:type IX secretion system PorP/SprF family membrane protein
MIQTKETCLIIILLVLCNYCISQDYPVYEVYYFSPFIVNPAVTGAESYPVADISIKQQWLGFPDAPTTFQLSGNYRIGRYDFYDPKGFVNKGPLKLTDRTGIGAAIYRDINGPSNYTGGLISYAYHMPVNYRTNLSFGMAAVGSYYAFNSSLLKPDDPGDYYLLHGNDNKFSINFNIGAYLYGQHYFIGISADKILPDISQVNEKPSFNPGYFIIGGYKLMAENNSFNFEPSLAIKKTGREGLALDIHTKLYIKRLNWIAISYGTSGNISFQFGLQLYRTIYLGYNYGYSISEIARYNYGSHEIHLGINLGLIRVEGIRKIAKQVVKD